ncbi:hypothetical protein PCE1_003761 [Barthelona sp. PCE]
MTSPMFDFSMPQTQNGKTEDKNLVDYTSFRITDSFAFRSSSTRPLSVDIGSGPSPSPQNSLFSFEEPDSLSAPPQAVNKPPVFAFSSSRPSSKPSSPTPVFKTPPGLSFPVFQAKPQKTYDLNNLHEKAFSFNRPTQETRSRSPLQTQNRRQYNNKRKKVKCVTRTVIFPPRVKHLLKQFPFWSKYKRFHNVSDSLKDLKLTIKVPLNEDVILQENIVTQFSLVNIMSSIRLSDFLYAQFEHLRDTMLCHSIPILEGYEPLFTPLSRQISSAYRCSVFVSSGCVSLYTFEPKYLSLASEVVNHRAAQIHSQTRAHFTMFHSVMGSPLSFHFNPKNNHNGLKLSIQNTDSLQAMLSMSKLEHEDGVVLFNSHHFQSRFFFGDLRQKETLDYVYEKAIETFVDWDKNVFKKNQDRCKNDAVHSTFDIESYDFYFSVRCRDVNWYVKHQYRDDSEVMSEVIDRELYVDDLIGVLERNILDSTVLNFSNTGVLQGDAPMRYITHKHFWTVPNIDTENDHIFLCCTHNIDTQPNCITPLDAPEPLVIEILAPNMTFDVFLPNLNGVMQFRIESVARNKNILKQLNSPVTGFYGRLYEFEMEINEILQDKEWRKELNGKFKNAVTMIERVVSRKLKEFKAEILAERKEVLLTEMNIDYEEMSNSEKRVFDLKLQYSLYCFFTCGNYWKFSEKFFMLDYIPRYQFTVDAFKERVVEQLNKVNQPQSFSF